MERSRQIVVVTDTPALRHHLVTWLSEEAYGVTTATTFSGASAHLSSQPNLVITQLRLGPYNGLHLAVRARFQGIPSVVIGAPDAAVERDAAELGATYVTTDELGRDQILSLAQHLIPQ